MATKNTDVKKDETMMVQEEEFGGLCRIIEYHRTRALAAVNGEHLQMCWQVGAYLSVRLESGSWSLPQLSNQRPDKFPMCCR